MTGTSVVAAAAAAITLVLSPQADPVAGERLYRTGIGASGKPAPALLQGDTWSDSSTLSCASCHLGSGFGSVEGGRVAPPLRWHRLTATGVNSHGRRRAYDEKSLMRAVTAGLDSEGRPLSALMPRFQLEVHDGANLAAFLRSRGRTAPVGVRDATVSLAAVVTPDADPAQRRAMEAVLAHFRSHVNPRRTSGSHAPRPRSADGTPEPAPLGYRDWELSIWELEGPPARWRAQLEKRQAARPVFALLSGLGGATWAPVHRFCEEHGIPCILPNVDAPPSSDEAGRWSVYYSAGVGVEAEVMARSIPRAARVAQVFRPGTVGAAGAARLARLRTVLDLEPPTPVPDGIDTVVLWLPASEALRYVERGAWKLWVSAAAAGPEPALPARATLVLPYALTTETRKRRGGFDAWARARAVAPGDFRIQEQTFFAFELFADALGHMRENLDRELLIERIEHSNGMHLFSASYSHLSFGRGQRFLSKGAYVTSPQDGAAPQGEWVVP